jgi:P27 family predicted phage terminase small subunit
LAANEIPDDLRITPLMPGTKNSGGHNRVSTQMHVLKGTFRSDRHGDQESPQPPEGIPSPPKRLVGEALGEWKRMVARLAHSRTLSVVDDGALYQYAKLFAETETLTLERAKMQKLSDELKRLAHKLDGYDLVQAIGRIVDLQKLVTGNTTRLRQQRMALRQYLVEFGMTPSARTRVKVQRPQQPARTGASAFRAQKSALPGPGSPA